MRSSSHSRGCELYQRGKHREDCTGCNETAQEEDDDDELISEAEQEKLGEMLLGKEAFATTAISCVMLQKMEGFGTRLSTGEVITFSKDQLDFLMSSAIYHAREAAREVVAEELARGRPPTHIHIFTKAQAFSACGQA